MEGQVEQAIDILKMGGLVAYPTDTVYGLGASAFNDSAILKIYQVKGRPQHLALPLLLADISQAKDVAREMPDIGWELAKRFLPGGLTLVLHKSHLVSDLISGGDDKIALRVPDHPVPIALIQGLGDPIIGTSANLSGNPSPLTSEEVSQQMGDKVDLIIDGECPGGIASTVVDLTVTPLRILREGAVSRESIAEVCKVGAKEG